MKLLATMTGLAGLAARRLWSRRLLALCLMAGLVAAVGLLASIPLYAGAVHNRLLEGQLTEAGTTLPPFAFLWRYVGAWNGDVDAATYAPADRYLHEQAPGRVNLPLQSQVRHVQTRKLQLFPAGDSQAFIPQEPLLWASVGFLTGLEEHVQLLEGAFPSSAPAGEDPVPVLISRALAEQLGLQVGERYVLFEQGGGDGVPLRIAGVWQPRPGDDSYWFYRPNAFDDVLLTSESAFTGGVAPRLDAPISQAVWYQVYDGRGVRTADVTPLLDRIGAVEARVTALLDGTTLAAAPVESLQRYGQEARLLTTLLTLFSLPVVGLVLYFVSLMSGMVVRHDRHETAVLRSRGGTRGHILLVYLWQGGLIGVVGLAGGLLLGRWLSSLMLHTRSFLAWDEIGGVLQPLSPIAGQYGLLAVALSLLALLVPALLASRHTIVSFKQERARTRRPLWQRAFLDVLLLVPPAYGWVALRQEGDAALVSAGDDLFSNPLLFLAPALFCFALSLLFVRAFPLLPGALARLFARLPGVTALLTTRQLARAAARYTGPLLLISLTLSLAIFSASMARTLDEHLVDQVYYQVGADLHLAELGENPEGGGGPGPEGAPAGAETGTGERPHYHFLPVGEHLQVDGVRAAARVGDYPAVSSIGGRQRSGRLLGVDRAALADVAFFRPDFAGGESLGSLMNRLGAGRDHLLVTRAFLAQNNLAVGDPLRLAIATPEFTADATFTIAGALDHFPTHAPGDGPLFIANLDYVHREMGGPYHYDVWLATDAGTGGAEIVPAVRDLGFIVTGATDARARIQAEQTRPERQGVFGLLSAGFLAAAALTVLGFLVYAAVSFRRRLITLGMLRAIGLSVPQMAAYLAGEQAALVAGGVALGTGVGVAASRLFIPFLQVGADPVPRFVVNIAWAQLGTIYAIFGALLLAAVVVLVVLLMRMKLFEAVKLGETV